jgi:transcriptional regulator with XRE-family HTH domain
VRALRLQAGVGLTDFADLAGMLKQNVLAAEKARRAPSVRHVVFALGLVKLTELSERAS